MSTPSTSGSPKSPLPMVAIVLVVLLALSLSLGGLTWFLIRGRSSNVTVTLPPEPASAGKVGASAGTVEGPVSGAAGFIEMFNGRDLEGWDFDPAVWSVRNGVISGNQKRAGAGPGLFWHETDLADFELRFRFRLVRGNSGIAYRATRLPNFDVGGYEFEIFTNKTGNLANVGSDRERRRLHRAGSDAEPTDANWHEGIIIANGLRLVHLLDGKTLCDVEDTDPTALRTGVIALGMSTGASAEFKDLRLKRFPKSP